MKLSEAIRLGATMKPQYFGGFRNDDDTATCALGAAEDAIGGCIGWIGWRFPLVDILNPLRCPECGARDLQTFIAHLNDDHRWTRERIADFVELHEGLPEPDSTQITVREELTASAGA